MDLQGHALAGNHRLTSLARCLAAASVLACAGLGISGAQAQAVGLTAGPTKVYMLGTDESGKQILVEAAQPDPQNPILPSEKVENDFRFYVSALDVQERTISTPGGGFRVDTGDGQDDLVPYPEIQDEVDRLVRGLLGQNAPVEVVNAFAPVLNLWLAPLAAMALIFASPSSEDEDDVQRWLVIEEYKPSAPRFNVARPCKSVRYTRPAGQHEPSPRAVACPLPTYASLSGPRLSVFAGAGRDHVDLSGLNDSPLATSVRFVDGGADFDTIVGSDFGDTLVGGEFGDLIEGRKGGDEIWGGGRLRVILESDEDSMSDDADHLNGDEGRDMIFGGWGNDLVDGGPNDDNLDPKSAIPSAVPDFQFDANTEAELGMPGVQWAALQGGPGHDVVIGGPGRDTMSGGPDQDTLLARERDFFEISADDVVDCNGVLAGDFRTDEFFRDDPGDEVSNCSRRLIDAVHSSDVLQWHLTDTFPWQLWPFDEVEN